MTNSPSLYFLHKDKVNDISTDLLQDDDRIKLLSYKEYLSYPWEDLRFFCHEYARYGIPTIELISFLRGIMSNKSVIEIGAGAGDFGYHLGISMTDNRMQEDPAIIDIYKGTKQPVIKYPMDVEKLDALDAVKKYKPEIVFASWVTTYSPKQTSYGSSPYGVKEKEILDLVDTYILVGNVSTHGDKPIMKLPHTIIDEPFIISRSGNRIGNRVWIWDKKDRA